MGIWAVVPVKPLRRGKSRLAGVLTEEERTLINYIMFGNTLKVLNQVKEIDHILVVSRDPSALALARDYGARTVLEDKEAHTSLNVALTRATQVARTFSATGVFIVPADIPFIQEEDIRAMISCVKTTPAVVIHPDRHMDGTNALLVVPPGSIEYSFGVGSFGRHCDIAKVKGICLEICQLPSIGLDLDTPEDLEIVREHGGLRRMGEVSSPIPV